MNNSPPQNRGLASRYGRVGEIYDIIQANDLMSPTMTSVLASLLHHAPLGCGALRLHQHMYEDFDWEPDRARTLIVVLTELHQRGFVDLIRDDNLPGLMNVIPTVRSRSLVYPDGNSEFG